MRLPKINQENVYIFIPYKVAKVIEMMIKKMGYKSNSIEDGIYVLDYLKNADNCDAILMDCKMPKVDGYTATKYVRAWEKDFNRKRVPIIAVTAHTGKTEEQKCLDSGMDDYLSKPLALNSLKEKIDYWTIEKAL